ncbi:nucleotidyltransferase domain-containing protein [Paenibacillus sp. P96]|uniref:Nucleotidyltransferase domain-containing protein n=1 Tax=Paenibacillus zeirhizosphaerae TaxID=2987519 RepID=A0ABT9FRB1_9BACL|nr:nucleotidyltransferase domain-containing protein [Paenibacillus sp. P96]MDP4097259.1 nucleotidyltransferase domain-containing protein [Paenibacillus sp. P96]
MRKEALEAAKSLVHLDFPDCSLAVLGGSAVRKQVTLYSDLDIVIYDNSKELPFRKTVAAFGWVTELFILNSTSYRELFDAGINEGNPTLQRIIAEGEVIRADEDGLEVLEEARADLAYGPMPWGEYELDHARYEITEHIQDLKGSTQLCETWFVASKLSEALCKLMLRANNQWIGEGKHLIRNLRLFDPEKGTALEAGLEELYRNDSMEQLIALTLQWLEPYGGPLLEGFEVY